MWDRARSPPGRSAFPTPAAADQADQNLKTEIVVAPHDATGDGAISIFAPAGLAVSSGPTPQAEHADASAPTSTSTSATIPSIPSLAPSTETSFVQISATPPLEQLAEPVCAGGTTAADLTAFFDNGDPIIGADYQRAYPLPDGRFLWLFQDAFLRTSDGSQLVHNVGLLQSGSCFQLIRNGSADAPTSYLLPESTRRFHHWFWPLGGDIGSDGNLHVFVAELRERGPQYLTRTEPTATWLVTIDAASLDVLRARLAPNPSAELYGWSVVSQGEHTYLYAHCYRQFGWDLFPFGDPPFRAHDWECSPDVTVGRVPRGEFDARPAYWNGSAWAIDPAEAVPVIPTDGRPVNPTQVVVSDGRFVAVTKVGDWWGETIVLDVSPAAEGPWHTYETITVEPSCERVCNTYFASVVPYGADESSFVVGLSHNTFPGDDLSRYAPTFLRVPTPA